MTNTYKRVSAALLSVLLLCMFTFGASAASSLNVGIKFWKERSDKESMANTGIDASRDVTLTRQSNGTYTLTLPIQQVSKMGVTGYLSGLTIGDVTYTGTVSGDVAKGTGEGRAFTLTEQQELVRLCAKGNRELLKIQKEALGGAL